MPRKRPTPEETLSAIGDIRHDDAGDEIAAMSDERIAAEITAGGGDPVAMAKRGAELAKDLIARRRRLAWQLEALEALDTAKGEARNVLAAGAEARAKMTRLEMMAEIQKAEDEGFSVSLAARKKEPTEATDDELRHLLEGIVILRSTKRET